MALTAKQKEGLELLCEASDAPNWAHGSAELGSFASVAVLMKIFENLLADPEKPSHRKLRTSNDKIKALLATAGVHELLIGSGFVEEQYTDGSPSVLTAQTVDRAVVQAGLERLKQLQGLQIVTSRELGERGVRGEPMQPSILADTAAPVSGAPAEAAPAVATPTEAAPPEAAPAGRGARGDVGHVTLIAPPPPSLHDSEEPKPGTAEWFASHMLGVRPDRAAPSKEDEVETVEEEERAISPSHRLLRGRGGLSAAGLDSIQRHIQTFAPSGIVDLSERGLTVLTPEVLDVGLLKGHAVDIFELDLHANCLVQVHRRLLQPLIGLRTLDLSHNGFSELPEAALLPSLTSLDLSHNMLDGIETSAELCANRLPALRVLRLAHNRLKYIPAGIAGLAALRDLDLSSNLIAHAQGDEPLRGTPLLETLSLADNKLLSLPADICSLRCLTSLALQANRLPSLPAEVSQLASLRTLHVGHNSLTQLPCGLGECRTLEALHWQLNPLRWPPDEIMARSLPRLLHFLRENAPPPPRPPSPPAKSAEEVEHEARQVEVTALRACLLQRQRAMEARRREAERMAAAAREAAARLAAAEAAVAAQSARVGDLLAASERSVAAARAAVCSISKEALEELRQLPQPPAAVQSTMQAVFELLQCSDTPDAPTASIAGVAAATAAAAGTAAGTASATIVTPATAAAKARGGASKTGGSAAASPPAPPSVPRLAAAARRVSNGGGGDGARGTWEAVRGVLRKNFSARVQAFSAAQLSTEACEAVRRALPRASRTAVHKASKACGPLYDWTGAQLLHAEALQQAAPLRSEASRLEVELARLQAQQRTKAAELTAAEESVAALDAEQRALEPEVAQAVADCDSAGGSKEGAASFKEGASRGALHHAHAQASLHPADRDYQCILPAYMLARLT